MSRSLTTTICLFLLFAGATSRASLREVAPGDLPALDADEGFLIVAVDSDTALPGGVRIQRNGGISAAMLKGINPGLRTQLYKATAGEYRFDHASMTTTGFIQYDLASDDEFRFSVKPGVINYPGDLRFRETGLFHAKIWLSNRGLRAMDWLESTHPRLPSTLPFVYAGPYPDPFPAFYRSKRSDPRMADAAIAPKPAQDLPVDVEQLWRPDRIDRLRISPDGELVAEVTNDGESWGIDIVDLRRSTSTPLLKAPARINLAEWKSERILVLGIGADPDRQLIKILRLEDFNVSPPRTTVLTVQQGGSIVDLLPGDKQHLLFASHSDNNRLVVQKIDIASQKTIDATNLSEGHRLNHGVENDSQWFTDGSGRLRAAIGRRDGANVLYYGSADSFHEVTLPGAPGAFYAIALSSAGDLIYGLSDDGRSQRDLVAFDPVSGKVTRTLFSRPGTDIESALFNPDKEPIGVTYYREGQVATEYFDRTRARLNAQASNAFPDETVVVIDHDANLHKVILGVESATRPPTFFLLDIGRKQAALLDEARPWLKGRAWSSTKVIHAESADHLPIEGYLTMPEVTQGRKLPLVVVSHGGPIGVRDSARFDPEVQFIASLGYAVLQVNFRGSGGYGVAFREAGKGSLGTSIEDDIDTALAKVLEQYPLDQQRMCAFGASYGGYSAMMSAIRWPERYRCVISMMGVSDRALVFTASDSGRSKTGRDALLKIMGDPRKDEAAFERISPAYRYRELRAPLLLVHGTEDPRVDYEHTRRLVRLLSMDGRPPNLITLEGAGHGIADAAQRKQVWPAVARFLQDHLGVP